MKSIITVFSVLVIIPYMLLTTASCVSRTARAQLVEEKLRACPNSPNCVSSEEGSNASALVKPLAFQGPPEKAWARLKETIRDMGEKIQEERDAYLWATFTSRVFRFVDDVEFRMMATDSIIPVRSGSRVGHSDLGVNRKRVEKLRSRFGQEKNQTADQ